MRCEAEYSLEKDEIGFVLFVGLLSVPFGVITYGKYANLYIPTLTTDKE